MTFHTFLQNKSYITSLLNLAKISYDFSLSSSHILVLNITGTSTFYYVKKYYKFMPQDLGVDLPEGSGAILQVIERSNILEKFLKVLSSEVKGLIFFKIAKNNIVTDVYAQDKLIENILTINPTHFGIGVTISQYPYPYDKNHKLVLDKEYKNIILDNNVGYAIAKGNTIRICQREVYRLLSSVSLPALQYRNDIGTIY